MFDLELIKNYYKSLDYKMSVLKKVISRPLTLTEKILYMHVNTRPGCCL